MRRSLKSALFVIGVLTIAASSAAWLVQPRSTPREISIPTEDFGEIRVRAPAGEPKAFVIMISDGDRPDGDLARKADRLVAEGIAVVPLSTQRVIMDLALNEDGACHYLFGDFEAISRDAQRAMGVEQYKWPTLLGFGDGGTLAYLAMAQAPVNSTAGAISIGFKPTLASKLPLCPGAPHAARSSDGRYAYGPFQKLPGRWLALSERALDHERAAFVNASPRAANRVIANLGKSEIDAAVKAVLEVGVPPRGELSDLPLIELPSVGQPKAMAVFYSGDGGWRDIDKSIAELLNQKGIAVVGVDSLRYLWAVKTPLEIARDLDRIVSTFQTRWGVRRTALLGYSMGAGILPPAWSELAKRTQDDTALIALLGLSPQSSFQVSVSSFLGITSPADADVRPALKALPQSKVLCFYGVDELAAGETACTAPELDGATRVERPGGHHFDGDYDPVAKAILDKLATAKQGQ